MGITPPLDTARARLTIAASSTERPVAATPDSFVKFLGTAGARFVMIRQARSSAGVLYSLGGFRLLKCGPPLL